MWKEQYKYLRKKLSVKTLDKVQKLRISTVHILMRREDAATMDKRNWYFEQYFNSVKMQKKGTNQVIKP